jgi:hypothetical protein
MKIHLPSRRLRLFVLSLSLFCSGIAAAQSTSTPAGSPAVSVVENKWLKVRKRDMSTLVIPPPEIDEKTGMVKPPNDYSDLRHISGDVPGDVRTKALRDDESLNYNYFYWIKIKNDSPRKIRSIAFDYVFVDPGSKQELKRYSRRSFHEIESKQTKWVWSGPAAGQNPPQQVTLEGLKKDRRSPFDERVEIKCILFTDGTGWRSPDAERKTCDELVKVTLQYNPRPNRNAINPGNP